MHFFQNRDEVMSAIQLLAIDGLDYVARLNSCAGSRSRWIHVSYGGIAVAIAVAQEDAEPSRVLFFGLSVLSLTRIGVGAIGARSLGSVVKSVWIARGLVRRLIGRQCRLILILWRGANRATRTGRLWTDLSQDECAQNNNCTKC